MRIDMLPTDCCGTYKIRPGIFLRNGASIVPGGVNFSVYSSGAKACELVLFWNHAQKPFAVIPFPESYRVGNVFAIIVFALDYENLEYGFRIDGTWNPLQGELYDGRRCLLDPYAKMIAGREVWGRPVDKTEKFPYRSKVVLDDFDWEGDQPLKLKHQDLIIYEAHVRGFTRHPSAQVKYPGTYAGLREKIPYLKKLGITAIELLPIFEFDEFDLSRKDESGKLWYNYWGYNTVGFFAPKAGYAASGRYAMQVDEFKNLIKELHRSGIRVLLDVVFNHTAEGDETGPVISFKGIDNKTYYLLTAEGKYYNFSGCGNTLNCNHPIVRQMILDCLRYWVSEYHVDGFRFDLASILGRDPDGRPLHNPPLLEALAYDPLLQDAILIAEAWDAGGLYQVGTFPAYGRWAEWNGRYRDDLRCFLKGDPGFARAAALRITGSEDIYDPRVRGDSASVNFIACHDGFTLWDLYAYQCKHNETNGWQGTDGSDTNHSWNCGAEGETESAEVQALRQKMVRNAAAVLLTSVGIPMLLAGDEFGNTQYGNNNPYCQDNEISWLDWSMLEKNQGLFRFFRKMIAFRKAHPVLRKLSSGTPKGYPQISLHGRDAWRFDSSFESRLLGVMFAGRTEEQSDEFIYLGINAHWEAQQIWLPALPDGMNWKVVVNTGCGKDCFFEPPLPLQAAQAFLLGERSVVICVSKR